MRSEEARTKADASGGSIAKSLAAGRTLGGSRPRMRRSKRKSRTLIACVKAEITRRGACPTRRGNTQCPRRPSQTSARQLAAAQAGACHSLRLVLDKIPNRWCGITSLSRIISNRIAWARLVQGQPLGPRCRRVSTTPSTSKDESEAASYHNWRLVPLGCQSSLSISRSF